MKWNSLSSPRDFHSCPEAPVIAVGQLSPAYFSEQFYILLAPSMAAEMNKMSFGHRLVNQYRQWFTPFPFICRLQLRSQTSPGAFVCLRGLLLPASRRTFFCFNSTSVSSLKLLSPLIVKIQAACLPAGHRCGLLVRIQRPMLFAPLDRSLPGYIIRPRAVFTKPTAATSSLPVLVLLSLSGETATVLLTLCAALPVLRVTCALPALCL
jgi:hypothetical protein